MPIASPTDVAARLGRPLTTEESTRVEALIEDAEAVVVGYCRQTFSDPAPVAVKGVVAKMAARTLSAATGPGGGLAQSQSAGPFSITMSAASTSGDVWLTAADKLALRPHRRGGGIGSVGLVGDRYSITETP